MSAKPHQIFSVDRNDGEERVTIAEEREKENLQDEEDKGDHEKQPEEITTKLEDESDKATASHRESESDAVDDEDDGFLTPTSSDHRIPQITRCPPAPMKPRPPPPRLKRKASSPPQGSAEIESIFSTIVSDQDDHKMKKARTDDDKGRS